MGTASQANGNGSRLESWKEIAAYLKRDRRTVQRWEEKEGLPVHRHVHESQATVFAHPGELDAWLAGRLESPPAELVAVPPLPARRFPWWQAIAAVAVLGAVFVFARGWNTSSDQITTSSPAARKFFAQADTAARQDNWPDAARFSQQALGEDPDMPSAHVYLAWANANMGRPAWEHDITRARELASKAGDSERLFIEASFHMLKKREDLAIPVLETLTQKYPSHYFGWANLSNAYRIQGRPKEAVETLARIADLWPDDYRVAVNVAMRMYPLDGARATQYARRAVVLMPEVDPATWNLTVLFHPFLHEWSSWNASAAAKELEFAANAGHLLRTRPDWPWYALRLSEAYLGMGQVRKAREWIDQIPDTSLRDEPQAYVSYMANDLEDARRRLIAMGPPGNMAKHRDMWVLWARLRPPGVERFFVDQAVPPQLGQFFRGEIALSNGKIAEAVTVLTVLLEKAGPLEAPLIQDPLADALDRAGDHERAIAVLKQATAPLSDRTRPALWIRNLARLLQQYRATNRLAEAQQAEIQLRLMLAGADPDFYLLKLLRK